jgi:hypothetical protein
VALLSPVKCLDWRILELEWSRGVNRTFWSGGAIGRGAPIVVLLSRDYRSVEATEATREAAEMSDLTCFSDYLTGSVQSGCSSVGI